MAEVTLKGKVISVHEDISRKRVWGINNKFPFVNLIEDEWVAVPLISESTDYMEVYSDGKTWEQRHAEKATKQFNISYPNAKYAFVYYAGSNGRFYNTSGNYGMDRYHFYYVPKSEVTDVMRTAIFELENRLINE